MTLHVLRCETCDYKTQLDADYGICKCSKLNRNITWQQWCILNDAGCASHSKCKYWVLNNGGTFDR